MAMRARGTAANPHSDDAGAGGERDPGQSLHRPAVAEAASTRSIESDASSNKTVGTGSVFRRLEVAFASCTVAGNTRDAIIPPPCIHRYFK